MQTDTRPEIHRPNRGATAGPCWRADLLEITASDEMPDAPGLRRMLDRIDLFAEDRRP